MDLRARLKALESRLGVGQPSPFPRAMPLAADEVPSNEPLAARMQRYATTPSARNGKRRITDDALATLLRGSLCSEGVVLVEHFIPCSTRHGNTRFADIHSAPLDFFAGGTEPCRDDLLFIDTETTGLAGGTGTIAFLFGLARVRGDAIEVRQYFLTRFGGEAAMLAHALEWLSPDSHLVSFNGKSFDVPLLATRYRLSRIAHPLDALPHIDLLHRTRAAFGRHWPDCRLQTAERELLRLFRDDDVPGHMIPQIWTDLLQFGETRDLRGVVEHNLTDILSLVALAAVVGHAYTVPGHHPQADALGIARAHRKSGDMASAVRHLEEASAGLPDDARLELAGLYARTGQYEKAVPVWTQLAQRNVLPAMERLAIYHEHKIRDYSKALHWTQQMMLLPCDRIEVERRRARLMLKSARGCLTQV